MHPTAAIMAMRQWHGQWIIDVGSDHGFFGVAADGQTRVAVQGSDPVRQAAVGPVLADHSVVRPLGWQPKPGLVYPMVLSGLAMTGIDVCVGGGVGDDAAVAQRLRAAICSAGPGGGPSVSVRLLNPGTPPWAADVAVSTPAPGSFWLRDATGRHLASCSAETDVLRQLEHIAAWYRIRNLANPFSRLANRVQIQLITPRPHDYHTPVDRPGLQPGSGGAIELEYRPHAYGFANPAVFIRLDNIWDRPLFGALLNLTDSFAVNSALFPGGLIDAGASAAVGNGKAIESALPTDRVVKPGAQVRDWLMLIVSEDKFNSDYFVLPRLGETVSGDSPVAGPLGILEHLALKARLHNTPDAPVAASDWWISRVAVDTRVPGDGGEIVD